MDKQINSLKPVKEAILEVRKAGSNKDQFIYDTQRAKDYSVIVETIKNNKFKDILEIGCAYGTLSYLINKLKVNLKTIDVEVLHNKDFFKKNKIKFEKLNIETDKIKGKYDCIIFTEVLEHLCYNPLPVMNNIKRALRNKGVIILSTPAREVDNPTEHIGNWLYHINWRQIPNFKKYKYKDANHHYYYLWELIDLIKEADLRISTLLRTRSGWFMTITK